MLAGALRLDPEKREAAFQKDVSKQGAEAR
jgi:hypothetical protein